MYYYYAWEMIILVHYKLSFVERLSSSLLNLIPRNRNTLAQLNLLNFNFSTSTLKDHKKYINEVIEGSNDVSVKEMMMSSLNPDLIQRGKVCD